MSEFLPDNYEMPEEVGAGLTDKEFNAWTDRYFISQTGNAEEYARMSLEQLDKIQWAKRAFARIRYQLRKQNE